MTAEDHADQTAAAATSPADGPVISFEHVFFKRVEDIYFRMDDTTGEPSAIVRLGEETLALPFPGIVREFKLDGRDADMLRLVAKGLKYVRALRIGDPVPQEILTRKASWEIQPRHRQIAYHRLALQLLGWLSGDEHVITEAEEILQVAGDPTFRKKINEAFGEAAEALGLGRENREEVVHHIGELANELAYIEALRDRFHAIERADAKIQELRRLYGNYRSVLEIADPVAKLMERAVTQFRAAFEQTDAQTGEIMAALRNIEAQKAYIQDVRDELHIRLMVWEDLLNEWEAMHPRRSDAAEDLLARTYRFLAPRFMPVDEWAMMTKLGNVVIGPDGKPMNTKPTAKRLGGAMEWF